VLPETGRDLILAGAILSILANPLLFFALRKAGPWLIRGTDITQPSTAAASRTPEKLPVTSLRNHAVIVGCGRVGSLVVEGMEAQGQPFLVIEERGEVSDRLRARGIEAITGNAAQPGILKAANLPGARWFISAIPNPFENGNLIEQARAANSGLEIIARAHSDEEVEHLTKFGANLIIMGEREIARGITEHIARRLKEQSVADVDK
jgi:CPA2 family monovalent cation:H+ antiporter-2